LKWPALSESDACLARALEARGHRVVAAPWNGPFGPFRDAALVVVRSSWDYHETPDRYRDWLGQLDAARTFNRPDLILWNMSKAHVLDLARRGARIPRTLEAAAEPGAIADALSALGIEEGVIKPLIGASGFGVERVRRGQERDALARAHASKRLDRILVQEFVHGIESGEQAAVFFDGVFSHGLRRTAAPGEFRINTQYGGRMEATPLPSEVIEQMRAVLRRLPAAALYCRVDGVVRGGELVLMEVEVNEPGLGLDLAFGSADRFADALLRRL
jgi:glutathione synthase/RimK-type ligase-like ATP-grasp enzyme